MDFLKTLLVYMSLTVAGAVQEGPLPADVPTPTPEPTAIVETVEETPALAVEVVVATAAPQPTATLPAGPTITPDLSYTNVKQGDRGDKVLKLQRRLIELGYLPEGADDGAFGGQTRKAVVAFQSANGLTADGVAGDATQTYLYQYDQVISAFTPAPTQEPTPTPTSAPVTEAPTEVPVTEVPVTEAPATEAPATEIPVTEEPVTEAPMTEAPTEAPATEALTEAPVTEAPTEEAIAEATEAAPAEDVTIAPPVQAVPVLTAAPTSEDTEAALGLDRQMDASVIFSHSGYVLTSKRLVDGVYEVFQPHVWLNEQGAAVVSLQEMMECVEGWQMTAQGDLLTLSAEEYEIVFDTAASPVACTVDGQAASLPVGALQLREDNLYVSEAFLQTVFHAATFWDDDEATLIIAIPDKAAALAAD